MTDVQRLLAGMNERNRRVKGAKERTQMAETRAAEAERQVPKCPAGRGETATNSSERKGANSNGNA